jgi:DNA polymerase-1
MLDYGYVSIDNAQPDLAALKASSIIAFDAETSGVNTAVDIPYGFSTSYRPDDAYFVWMTNRFFTDKLADEEAMKIGHNVKFDRSMLKKHGTVMNNLCDTMIAAHLLEESRLSLKTLLKRCVPNFDLDIKQFPDYPKPIPHSNLQELAEHFAPHAAGALILWNKLQRELRANGLWKVFWEVEMPMVPVLSDMELNGAMIDVPYLESLGKYYDDKVNLLEEGCFHYAGRSNINFNSADQAAKVLYDELGIPKPPRFMWTEGSDSKASRPTVDKEWVERFKGKHPIINPYLAYKSYRHLKDTYVTGILERLVNGRIHTNFNQTRTRTGRLSSTDPNLQNIPQRTEEGRKIRKAFVAPKGKKIMKGDMSQVELRKMACLSDCKPMLDAFKAGRDIHTETAIRMFHDETRRAEGKTRNFKLVYGGGTEEEQKALFEAYPEVKIWTDSMRSEFEILGYARTDYGRRSHLGNFSRMTQKEIGEACRQGISVMDQGSCSEYLKIGSRKTWNETHDSDTLQILSVHDEQVLEVPEEEVIEKAKMLSECMYYSKLQIPLPAEISVGLNWTEQVKLKL